MDRFYTVLAHSITASADQSEAARAAVYAEARAQLDRLIGEAEPPMSAEAANAHRNALEAAIARIEAELARSQRRPSAGSAGEARTTAPPSPLIRPRQDRKPAGTGDGWSEPARRNPRRRRLLTAIGLATAAVAAIAFGCWMVLSSVFAPELPGMETVARRLENSGASLLFSGAAAERFRSGADTTVSNSHELFGPGSVHLETRGRPVDARRGPKGARIVLGEDIRPMLDEATLRVIVVARADSDNPSPEFAVAIDDGDSASSGWQRQTVDAAFRPYNIEYAFDSSRPDKPVTISVVADTAGQGRSIEIGEISLRIVPVQPGG